MTLPDSPGQRKHTPADGNDTALRQYSTILGYLQYENSVYWTRSQLFLVANAALLGLVASGLPTSMEVPWARLYTIGIAAAGGLLLSILWKLTLESAKSWIDRWHEILVNLEPAAFGNIEIFRDVNKMEGKYPVKRLASYTVALFLGLWVLGLIYLISVGIGKATGLCLL